jgi:hypothetical protein
MQIPSEKSQPEKNHSEGDLRNPNSPARLRFPGESHKPNTCGEQLNSQLHHSTGSVKKNTTHRTQQHPLLCFRVLSHPHQSPPSKLDCENLRNLAFQVKFPRNSLLRFKIFVRRWALDMLCPRIMRSAAQRQHIFVPAVLTKPIVLARYTTST